MAMMRELGTEVDPSSATWADLVAQDPSWRQAREQLALLGHALPEMELDASEIGQTVELLASAGALTDARPPSLTPIVLDGTVLDPIRDISWEAKPRGIPRLKLAIGDRCWVTPSEIEAALARVPEPEDGHLAWWMAWLAAAAHHGGFVVT